MKNFKKILSATIFGLMFAMFSPAFGFAAFSISMLTGGGTNISSLFTGFFDPTGLTLPVDGIKDISELIYSSKFKSPDWKQFMDIETGIKADKQIVITGHFNGLAGAVRAACDTTANSGSMTSVEKTWQPKYISDRFEECYEPLQATFWKYMLANGLDKIDLTQSDYEGFILQLLDEYISDDFIYRLLFFSDPAIAAGVTNNLGAGDLKYFNAITGIFKQLDAIVATTARRGTTITENAGANYAAQAFATASPTVHPVTDYFNAMLYGNGLTTGASMELRGVKDPVILCTQTVADQYAQERKAVTNIELAYTRIENGMDSFKFNNIDVIPIYTWDRLIARHFDNGTKLLKPHRILYTSKSNIRVATEETANFTQLGSEYNSYHEKLLIKFGFNLDVKVIEDAKVQYAS